MGMRIPRPIISRENNRLYGNAFEMTQREQHLYECVQPLQGHITFSDRSNNNPQYHNNFAWKQGEKRQGESVFGRIESLLLFFVLTLVVCFLILWWSFSNQFALNKVFITQFVVDGASYKMEDAGFTKPADCFAIALVLISTSLLVGWQSNRGLESFHPWVKNILIVTIGILQSFALIVHIIMFNSEGSTGPTAMSFTNWGVLWLHIVAFVLTLVIFWFITGLPDSREDKSFETENNFWLCVVGDLNLIVCYALIYRACDSQVSIHDDASTFFDVVCIVLIGFLQHIANILMIFHAHIQNSVPKDDTIHNIARTRMLLFFMIGIVTIFLYLRISPTYTEYPAGVPFELTRSLALIAFISMNSLHSLRYELEGSKIDAYWESTPTWKLMATAFLAVGSGILLVVFVYEYRDDNTFKLLNAITT